MVRLHLQRMPPVHFLLDGLRELSYLTREGPYVPLSSHRIISAWKWFVFHYDTLIFYYAHVQSLQATISTDNYLRIYECLEQPSLQTWSQSEEIDVLNLPSTSSQTSSLSLAFATPTQTSATLDGASATLVAQALQQSQSMQGTGTGRPGLGNREADGGWCISWCKERYWGEVIAVGCGTGGIVKV